MRDLRITKRNITRNARPLFRSEDWSSVRPFSTVTGSAFGGWMREHWALAKPNWFGPVSKDYRKEKQLALPSWPPAARSGETKYTFAPTIQLTCFAQYSSSSFFEVDAAGVLQTLTLKQFSNTREQRLMRHILSRNDRHTRDRELSTKVHDRRQRLTLLDHSRSREVVSNTHHLKVKSTKLSELLSSLFSTLRETTTQVLWTKFAEKSFHAKAQRSKAKLGTFAPLRELTSLFTRSDSSSWMKSLLLQATGTQIGTELRLAPNIRTTLTLNFARPKVSEAELVSKRISHFVSSPALTYLKRQEATSEGIVNALRELRSAQVQTKPPVAPSPPSIEQITSQVRTQLEREIRIERERRGL